MTKHQYSVDLRERIIERIKSGKTKDDVKNIYGFRDKITQFDKLYGAIMASL
jgi:ASC-1-like (ASCH) protein